MFKMARLMLNWAMNQRKARRPYSALRRKLGDGDRAADDCWTGLPDDDFAL